MNICSAIFTVAVLTLVIGLLRPLYLNAGTTWEGFTLNLWEIMTYRKLRKYLKKRQIILGKKYRIMERKI